MPSGASPAAARARLNRIWKSNTISSASKFKLYKSLVTPILLYGCETWTLLADSVKRIQTFKTKCLRKLLTIFYLEHKTNDWVRRRSNLPVGPREHLQATVKGRKRAWLGHDDFSKTILQGTLEDGRRRVWRRNAGITTSKSGHPCPCQNCSQ